MDGCHAWNQTLWDAASRRFHERNFRQQHAEATVMAGPVGRGRQLVRHGPQVRVHSGHAEGRWADDLLQAKVGRQLPSASHNGRQPGIRGELQESQMGSWDFACGFHNAYGFALTPNPGRRKRCMGVPVSFVEVSARRSSRGESKCTCTNTGYETSPAHVVSIPSKRLQGRSGEGTVSDHGKTEVMWLDYAVAVQ
jgi:hypothetical protein